MTARKAVNRPMHVIDANGSKKNSRYSTYCGQFPLLVETYHSCPMMLSWFPAVITIMKMIKMDTTTHEVQ